MRADGGNTDVMANYLPVMLQPVTMNWLTSLGADTIDSWDDLKGMFIENYKVTCERLVTKHDLTRVYKRIGELLRSYIQCFSKVRNQVPNILESEVITAFVHGLYHHDELHRKFNRRPPATIGKMF